VASVRSERNVGRYNALDKLAGALVPHNAACSTGAVLVTSRVSVEMVQKTAMIGVPVLVAISAPATLASETAEKAGITLVLSLARTATIGSSSPRAE
jgi:FdhD protein